MRVLRIVITAFCLLDAGAALAQTGAQLPKPTEVEGQEQDLALGSPQVQPRAPVAIGRVADSPVGKAGERQMPAARPMARISSRIQNRVQSRLRTRIDRNYDPRANTQSPFALAEDEARNSRKPNR